MGDRIFDILGFFLSNDFPKLKEIIRNVFSLLKIPVFLILFYYSLLSIEWLFEWDYTLIDMLRDTENKYLAFFTNPNLLFSYVTESIYIIAIMLIFLVIFVYFDYSMFTAILFFSILTIGESLLVLQLGLKLYLMLPKYFSITFLVTGLLIAIAYEVIKHNNLWENMIARYIIISVCITLISGSLF